MAEKVEIFELETTKASRSIKDLRDDIKTLRNALDECEVGSDEFNKTLDKLTDTQEELKSTTKKTTSSMEGSYDSLTQKMVELKNQWKSTADEIEKADLGEEIANINKQLKNMDDGFSDYQRNVSDCGVAFENLNTVSQDVIGSFDIIEGGLKAIGVESDVVAGLMDKLSGAMKMTQGFKSVKEGVGNFQQLKVAASGASSAMGGLSASMLGVVGAFAAVAAGAIALVANMDKIKQSFVDISDQTAFAELNKELTELSAQTASDKIVRVKELSEAYSKLGDDLNAKQEFVAQYKGELEDMGIAMGGVNDADNVFINNTTAYVEAIMSRAKADALRTKASEEYSEFLKEQAQLEIELAEAIAKKNAGVPDKKGGVNFAQSLVMAGQSEPGGNSLGAADFVGGWDKNIAEENVKAIEDKIADAETKMEEKMKAMFEEAASMDNIANELLTSPSSSTGSSTDKGGSNSSTGKSPEVLAQEQKAKMIQDITNRLYKFNLNTREKELAEAQRIYESELQLLEGNEEAKVILAEEYAKKQADINAKYDNAEAAEQAAIEAERAKLEARRGLYTSLQDEIVMSQMTASEKQLQIIANQYEEEKRLLDELLAEKVISQEEYALALDGIDAKRKTSEEEITKVVETETVKYGDLGFKIKETGILTEESQKKIATGVNLVGNAFGQTSQLLSTLANNQNKQTEEGFENYKKLSIAAAVMSMLQGIISSWTSAMSLPAPLSFITGGVMSAFTATLGGIQIDQIKKQQFTSSGGGGNTATNPTGNVSSVPPVNTAALLSTPINYTSEIQGANIESNVTDSRVYVVESDITSTQNRVRTVEDESTF